MPFCCESKCPPHLALGRTSSMASLHAVCCRWTTARCFRLTSLPIERSPLLPGSGLECDPSQRNAASRTASDRGRMVRFWRRIYRRQIYSWDDQRLAIAEASGDPVIRERAFLEGGAIDTAARQLAPGCAPAVSIEQYGKYATAPNRSEERVFPLFVAAFGSTSTLRMARCATDSTSGCSLILTL